MSTDVLRDSGVRVSSIGLTSHSPPLSSGKVQWFPLWEWLLNGPSGGELTSDQKARQEWRVYSQAHNEAIEHAFQSGLEQCEVVIGIRTYIIFFDGRRVRQSGRRGMVQKDKFSLKMRDVRRRIVSSSEREASILKAAGSIEGSTLQNDSCSLCCERWVTNPTMPVVRLPDCGHSFHGACAQYLADGQRDCPLCRTPVCWSEVEGMKRLENDAEDVIGNWCQGRRSREARPLYLRNDKPMQLLVHSQRGDVRQVQECLRLGVPVNTRSPKNATPLISAAQYGRTEVVNCLLAAKADVHLRTDAGKTALSLAMEHGHLEVVLILSKASSNSISL
jgi:hypothetical protein